MSRLRDVALLLLVLALITGLASAQSQLKYTLVDSGGAATTSTFDPTSTVNAMAPAAGKYWDGLASTDYYNVPPYVAAPPNPQIAAGPDDILTIVNRTIARYPNPNAAGNTLVTNPYNNPPTEKVWLDTWLGSLLSPQTGSPTTALCPSGTGSNTVCVIDNASIRYDQLQGRFVVLFTVTDVPAHRSNWVLIVSKYAQVRQCTGPNGGGTGTSVCPASSPLFTPPVIAPIVGGTQTGGVNATNWVAYTIPINLSYATAPAATTVGNTAINGLGTGIVGAANTVATGGGNFGGFVTTPFCTNGGPGLPLNPVTARTCTNYFPTGARMGFDNDNIILTAPVLDQSFSALEGVYPYASGQRMGPYVGTRVVSLAKLAVYNGTALSANQPPACLGNNPIDCNAVNLSDNVRTGTLTLVGGCGTGTPAAGACAPTSPTLPNAAANPIAPIFWEPDNLRGRALASFDAQVAPSGSVAGVITPIDYLVGTQISDDFGTGNTAAGSRFFVQPIVYTCPGSAIYNGPSGVTFCGVTASGQVPDLPVLGGVRTNVVTLAGIGDPAPVGQGYSAAQMTTNPLNVPVNPTTNSRLFVGDSRPQQVMFREGLLYVARNARIVDFFFGGPLGTSTVLYDVIKTGATGVAVTPYSLNGAHLGNPALVIETEWFNGQNVPDPGGNLSGFGMYQPMFDSPADVINSGPVSPINLFPWFEKLFVGMTTGGTSNLDATFARNFPSLWDFRPGDDAYDTVMPYLDPYTGTVITTVPCAGDVTLTGTVASGASVTTITGSTSGLAVGMYLVGAPGGVTIPAGTTVRTIAGNTITLSSGLTVAGTTPVTGTFRFSRLPNSVSTTANQVTAGSNLITVASISNLAIGATISSGGSITRTASTTAGLPANTVLFSSLTNIGAGQAVAGGTTTVTGVTTIMGGNVVNVPFGSLVAPGMAVSGTGIPAGTTVQTVAPNGTGNPITLTLSAAATATGTADLTFSAAALVPAGTTVVSTQVVNTGTGPQNQVTLSGALPADLGPNGIPLSVATPALFPAGTTILNISTTGGVNTLTMSANALVSAANVPVTFSVAANTSVTCPMIPFSSRGGASTDPNDGSLWLYGEFAKNRLVTIGGPGQWGTAVANYPLDFPPVDPYNNDNAFFGDVSSATQSPYFTWIQIAKNLGIAVPSATGPCPANAPGGTPIQQPPAPGTTPTPGTSQLICPYFAPGTTITRAEMAYWVIRAQMDETQVTAYLNATGGDPTVVGSTASSFADVLNGTGTITNPFLCTSTAVAGCQPSQVVTNAMLARYIEVMYRRGYTKGCQSTFDPQRLYCPNRPVTRAEMSVFLIRAKMNNVFPTTLSGIPLTAPYGDNFGVFTPPTPYFTDLGTTDAAFAPFIQKMRELRISNGKNSFTTYVPNDTLTRQEIATFIVRAFFL